MRMRLNLRSGKLADDMQRVGAEESAFMEAEDENSEEGSEKEER